jgi:hypothetical protein
MYDANYFKNCGWETPMEEITLETGVHDRIMLKWIVKK